MSLTNNITQQGSMLTITQHGHMHVPVRVYANEPISQQLIKEITDTQCGKADFIPALVQLCNVSSLPSVLGVVGLPDIHAGYGLPIGGVAAMEADNKNAIISPGGIGFDINCGVRLIRTSLDVTEVRKVSQKLADALYARIPVGLSTKCPIPIGLKDIDEILGMGMDWCIREGLAWPEDTLCVEERGRMIADPSTVSESAKKRGQRQLGSLGSGNHYCEVQYVSEIYDTKAAEVMGITKVGQVCVMIHCGSRGLGHQVADDYVKKIEENSSITSPKKAKLSPPILPDPQLAYVHLHSDLGREYFSAMNAAANFAWANRQTITFLVRQAFAEVFNKDPLALGMHLVYDVSHNICKIEKHSVEGKQKNLLIHRKGATGLSPAHSEHCCPKYSSIGTPVLVGGSMGTHSYVLCGTEKTLGDQGSFGSVCHGAGRAVSRTTHMVSYEELMKELTEKGVVCRCSVPKHLVEEAPSSYKDVRNVVECCCEAGLAYKVFKLDPMVVIKG